MKTTPNIEVLFVAILNALISTTMSSYVDASLSSSEDPAVLMFSQADVDKKVEFSREETNADIKISAIQMKTCRILAANCWFYLKQKKFHYPVKHRFNTCLKRIQGFQVCKSLSANDTRNELKEAKEWIERDQIERNAKAMQAEYREGRIFYEKAHWKSIRAKVAEYIRGPRTTSTTVKTTTVLDSESDSSSDETTHHS